MMKGRKIATIAALGTSTAALAMLTGLAGARADELSDLRLNQQLLSQRIDQLAAVGLAPDVFSVNTNPAASAPAIAGSFPRDPYPRHRHLNTGLRADRRSARLLDVGRQPERQPA